MSIMACCFLDDPIIFAFLAEFGNFWNNDIIYSSCKMYLLLQFLAQLTLSARAFSITLCPLSVGLSVCLLDFFSKPISYSFYLFDLNLHIYKQHTRAIEDVPGMSINHFWIFGRPFEFDWSRSGSGMAQDGSSLVHDWFRISSRLIHDWFRIGLGLGQDWLKIGLGWFVIGSRLVWDCSWLVQYWFRIGLGLVQD